MFTNITYDICNFFYKRMVPECKPEWNRDFLARNAWYIGHSSITNYLTLSPFESLYVLMLLDKKLIFAFFLLFRRLQSCGPGNGGGRTWLWLHQCLICRCKFPFPIFQFMMPYFDGIFWALNQNLSTKNILLFFRHISM